MVYPIPEDGKTLGANILEREVEAHSRRVAC